MVEHHVRNVGVESSNLFFSTIRPETRKRLSPCICGRAAFFCFMKLRTLTSLLLGLVLAVLPADARRPKNAITVHAATTNAVAAVVRTGFYTSRDDVAAYIKAFGTLPGNFITKAEARRLGWQGGPVEPYAPGKSIGGDRFGNYERQLPDGRYKECDIDTKGRPRGAKRIIFSDDRRIYYTGDHYRTFEKVP